MGRVTKFMEKTNMKSVFCAGAGIQSILFFLNDGYLSATLACGSGVSPRTVRWGGTLLPQAVGRAMEWPDSCPKRKLSAVLWEAAVCLRNPMRERVNGK